jgi:hypothetical protein
MSRLRMGSAWLAALLLVAALVCAGVVIGNRNDAEASRIRADAVALSRTSAHELAVQQKAAAEAVARRQAAVDRADARRAARERRAAEAQQAAEEEAARERAAQRRAAREQAAQERAQERAQQRADRRKAAAAAAAAAAVAAAGHDLAGSMTEPDVTGALVAQVGGRPGQPLTGLDAADRAKVDRLRDQVAAGRTFACPAGSGGDYEDLRAGTRVVVSDGTGAVLATTQLTGGTLSKVGCTFAFRTHVADADAYRLQVGHRDALSFSREELDKQGWSVATRP